MQSAAYTPQSAIAPGPDILSQFRVRTVAEVIDAAFSVYRRNFLTFLLIIVIGFVPIQLLSYLADIFLLGTYTEPDFTATTTSTIAASSVASQLSTLKTYLETLVEYLPQWALTTAILGVLFGQQVSVGSAYDALRRESGRALGLIFLQMLIVLAIFSPMIIMVVLAALSGGGDVTGLLLPLSCLNPFTSLVYLIVSVRLQLTLPAAVVEDLTPRQAIRRSFELTRNYWWRTFALVMVLGILATVVSVGPATIITALLGIGFQDIYTMAAITKLVSVLTGAIFAPIQMGAIAFYYFDQRVRREGFDLDTAIAERYEAGDGPPPMDDGRWATDDRGYLPGAYEPYGQGQPVLGLDGGESATQPTVPIPYLQAATPTSPPPFLPKPDTIVGDLAKEADLSPLLATGHNEAAMQTFRKHVVREERKMGATPDKSSEDKNDRRVRRIFKPGRQGEGGGQL